MLHPTRGRCNRSPAREYEIQLAESLRGVMRRVGSVFALRSSAFRPVTEMTRGRT
jgi:hypothetical protein